MFSFKNFLFSNLLKINFNLIFSNLFDFNSKYEFQAYLKLILYYAIQLNHLDLFYLQLIFFEVKYYFWRNSFGS